MTAVCVESSHKRGMGHFYRALNIWEFLKSRGEGALIIINQDKVSSKILEEKGVLYETADYEDFDSGWESRLIRKYQIQIWLLDKFYTDMRMAENIKSENVLLAAIDDCGPGAELADLHFCSMLFHNRKGRHIYSGNEYMILNPEIAGCQRQRTGLKKILVTLGGSDTYGVTVKVVRLLKENGYCADIITGPNFCDKDRLMKEIDERFQVYAAVPSLTAKFYEYDLAVTGGGVTCFEANASGLPCLIVANELHEIETGKYLAGLHGAEFAGYYKDITKKDMDISRLDIKKMSSAAMRAVPLGGMENVYRVMQKFRREAFSS